MGKHRNRQHNGRPRPAETKAGVARKAGLVPVSDHALVRFLERVGGMDVESVRMSLQIGLSRAAAAARALGNADFVIKLNGQIYVVRDDTVITVLEDNAEHGEKPLPLARRDTGLPETAGR